MPTLQNKLERFRRDGVPLEHGSRVTPQGTTYWAKSGNISADGFKTLGAALNALLKELDAPTHSLNVLQKLAPQTSATAQHKEGVAEPRRKRTEAQEALADRDHYGWNQSAEEIEREKRKEEARLSRVEYLDPKYGSVEKVDAGYVASPVRGTKRTFPTSSEAVGYLKSISGGHRYIKKKR